MPSDVFLLVFANSQASPLASLVQEEQKIYGYLQEAQDEGRLTIVRESNPTAEIINTRLAYYAERIAVFHFSGHANDALVLLGDQPANSAGLAYQLEQSAKNGALKLVILNGCSTKMQVKRMLDLGVPAVIATHAAVEDQSALAFADSFYYQLAKIGTTIREAFFIAIKAAQLATARSLNIENKQVRHLDFLADEVENPDLWELFSLSDEAVDFNPMPTITQGSKDFVPNTLLLETLVKVLQEQGNLDMMELVSKEAEGRYVSKSDKLTVAINALPFPVGTHLQKLFSFLESDSQFDQVSKERIGQITEVFQTSMELMAFVMLSQLWELKLKHGIQEIPEPLNTDIKTFILLNSEARSQFDHLPFIRQIRQYFDSLGINYFIEELVILINISGNDQPFGTACTYLANLRRQFVSGTLKAANVFDNCERAEKNLSIFFQYTGFLHRYNLTSIKGIDIKKYRHMPEAQFKHSVTRLMHALGRQESIYYRWNSYLDHRGIILLKGQVKYSGRGRYFVAENLEFLNLSPFVIDKNAFDPKADLADIMFITQFRPAEDFKSGICVYKNVRRPDIAKENLSIDVTMNPPDTTGTNHGLEEFDSIRFEFAAFFSMLMKINS